MDELKKVVKESAQVRKNFANLKMGSLARKHWLNWRTTFWKSLDGKSYMITLDELTNVVKVCAQVTKIFCKSLDGQSCTVTLQENKNIVMFCAKVRKISCKSLDWQSCTLTLNELKNILKVRAQVWENICKSLDGQPCTVTLNELKNVVKVCAQVRKLFTHLYMGSNKRKHRMNWRTSWKWVYV
jgi:hypothetical protein